VDGANLGCTSDTTTISITIIATITIITVIIAKFYLFRTG